MEYKPNPGWGRLPKAGCGSSGRGRGFRLFEESLFRLAR